MSGKTIRGVRLRCLPLMLLALISALATTSAHAADPQPVLVYQNPAEGQVIRQPAFGIQLCFETAVNIKDQDKGGDFDFTVIAPDGEHLGSRDVFQPDGLGVTIYPGAPIGDTKGQWKFQYRVTSPDAQSALEGDINYTVDPNGTPLPQATPPVCVGPDGTATASPEPTPTVTPFVGSATPAGASASPTAKPASATPTASPLIAESNGSSDTLTYVALAVGIAGIFGGLIVIGLLIRLRISRRQGR